MKPINVLGREYSMKILGATEKPTPVTHLCDSLNIPPATCYRRVNELAAVGFLEEISSDEDDTAKSARYRRTTDAVGIRFGQVPSLFAWTCVREAVGTDASTLKIPTQTETQSQSRSGPMGESAPNAAVTEQQTSTGEQ